MSGSSASVYSDAADRNHRAAALKERVYVAFTVLAVIIALRTHGGHPSAIAALGTLAMAVVATIVAVYVADLVSSMVINERLPHRNEHRRILAGTLGAGVVALPPVACIALAVAGAYSASVGLLAAMLVILITLIGIGIVAVHNLHLRRPHKMIVLTAEAVLALGVIALELWSHTFAGRG